LGTSVAPSGPVAIFSKWRGGGGNTTHEDEKPERAHGPALTVRDLGEALVEIGQAVAAPEDALEPALQAVVEASGAAAGALCLYDVRQCVLRLACDVGLSDEGCGQLQTVRRGDPACWDMPLHGLLNRRAYLIESAQRNRYVPRLLAKNRQVSTVICIPLYEGITPLASLVLVSAAPRIFGQSDITALWKPLREFGKMIDRIRRQGFDTEPQAAPFREQIALQQRTIAAEFVSLEDVSGMVQLMVRASTHEGPNDPHSVLRQRIEKGIEQYRRYF